MIITFEILYGKLLLDNKLHSKKDLEERLDVPLLVEIPSSGDKTIEENDRSGLAEAFRILRTNLNFVLGRKKEKSNVLFVTSTISGERSEERRVGKECRYWCRMFSVSISNVHW